MGFIAPSYLAKLEVVTEDVNFDYPFKLGDSEELWPSPRGLVEAAVEHFAFQSAEDLPHAGASGSAVDARLDRLESSVDRMAEMMTQLVSAQQPPVVGRKVSSEVRVAARSPYCRSRDVQVPIVGLECRACCSCGRCQRRCFTGDAETHREGANPK